MAKYPIKMLKDENNTPFVPLVGTDAIVDPSGDTLEQKLAAKLESTNIIQGPNITLEKDGNNITISATGKGAIIDNLDTTEPGVGSLDARQGNVLKNMIPVIANNLTTIDATQTLSAYQGYILNNRVVPRGGDEGQVLKKSADGDWQLEWGDAADPNAIIGDGTIKKIVYLTWDEYKALEAIDEYTEYHITDMSENSTLLNREDIQDMIDISIKEKIPTINNTLTSTSTTEALSAAQGKILNDDLTSLKNKSNLVRHIEINSTVNEVNIDNLDIVRDGGIYDILIYCYSGGTQRDWYMTINNQSTANYTSIRTFARHGGGSSGECSPINPYANINENKFVMGDAYNRWLYTGVLTLFSEITSTGSEARVPRIQGKTTIAEPASQSLIDMGGYYNPNSGVDNITSLQFKITGFAAGHIFIFKREY